MSARRKVGKRGKPVTESHVRLYKHELECRAYRELSPAARALLVEMRALYSPSAGNNQIFFSVRRMRERCNLTQLSAMRARDELVEKGWITIVQFGAYQLKARHATVFALENEAPNSNVGTSLPSKAYIYWQPSQNKPVAITTKKADTRIRCRPVPESGADSGRDPSEIDESAPESGTEKPNLQPSSIPESGAQIELPGGLRSGSAVPALDPAPAPALALGAKRRKST